MRFLDRVTLVESGVNLAHFLFLEVTPVFLGMDHESLKSVGVAHLEGRVEIVGRKKRRKDTKRQ